MNLSSPKLMICRYSSLVPSKYCFVPGAGFARSSCSALVTFSPTNSLLVPSSILISPSLAQYHTVFETTTPAVSSTNGLVRSAPVKSDLHPLHRRESVANRAINRRQQGFDLFRGIDDFDDDRQIRRQVQDFCRADSAPRAKTFNPAEHCRSRQTVLSRGPDNPFVKQHPGVPITLADKDPEQRAIFWQFHVSLRSRAQVCFPSIPLKAPLTTASRC